MLSKDNREWKLAIGAAANDDLVIKFCLVKLCHLLAFFLLGAFALLRHTLPWIGQEWKYLWHLFTFILRVFSCEFYPHSDI
jgi:hypothetical protein